MGKDFNNWINYLLCLGLVASPLTTVFAEVFQAAPANSDQINALIEQVLTEAEKEMPDLNLGQTDPDNDQVEISEQSESDASEEENQDKPEVDKDDEPENPRLRGKVTPSQTSKLVREILEFEAPEETELSEDAILGQLLKVNKTQSDFDYFLEYLNSEVAKIDRRRPTRHSSSSVLERAQRELAHQQQEVSSLLRVAAKTQKSSMQELVNSYFLNVLTFFYLSLGHKEFQAGDMEKFLNLWSLELSLKTVEELWAYPSKPQENLVLEFSRVHEETVFFHVTLKRQSTLAEILRYKATNPHPNRESYLDFVKCAAGIAALQKYVDVKSLGLQKATAKSGLNLTHQFCEGLSAEEIYKLGQQEVFDAMERKAFTLAMSVPSVALGGHLRGETFDLVYDSYSLKYVQGPEGQYVYSLIPTAPFANRLVLNPYLFTDAVDWIEHTLAQPEAAASGLDIEELEKLMKKKALDYKKFRTMVAGYDEAIDRFLSGSSEAELEWFSFLQDEGLFAQLIELLQIRQFSERADLRDERNLSDYLKKAELLLWENALRDEIVASRLPLLSVYRQSEEGFEIVLRHLFVKAKEKSLKSALSNLLKDTEKAKVNTLEIDDVTEFMYHKHLKEKIDALKSDEDTPRAHIELVTAYAKEIGEAKPGLDTRAFSNQRRNYVNKLLQTSQYIHGVMTTPDLEKIPYNEEVLLLVLAPVFHDMDPLVKEWFTDVARSSANFVQKSRMIDEALDSTLEDLRAEGVLHHGSCENDGFSGFLQDAGNYVGHFTVFPWVVGKVDNQFESKQEKSKETIARKKRIACDVEKMKRYFAYDKASRPESILDPKVRIDRDFPLSHRNPNKFTSEQFVSRYRQVFRALEFTKLRPLAMRFDNVPNIEPEKGEDQVYLYQILNDYADDITNVGEAEELEDNEKERAMARDRQILREATDWIDNALLLTAQNDLALIETISNAADPSDLYELIAITNFVTHLLGDDHLDDFLEAHQYENSNRAANTSLKVYPTMLEYHKDIVADLMKTKNLGEQQWDSFYHDSMAPWQAIITFTLLHYTVGRLKVLSPIFHSFQAKRATALGAFLVTTVSILLTDSAAMTIQRIPRLERDLTKYKKIAITEARQSKKYPAFFNGEDYLMTEWFILREIDNITRITWNPLGAFWPGEWGRIATNLFWVSVPGVITGVSYAYHAHYVPRKLIKMDTRLKKIAEDPNPSAADLLYVAKNEAKVQKRYLNLYYQYRHSFDSLGLKGKPNWDPIALFEALKKQRLEHKKGKLSDRKLAKAEQAYKELILTMGQDLSAFVVKSRKKGQDEVFLDAAFSNQIQGIFGKRSANDFESILKFLQTEIIRLTQGSGLR